jgi:hypothetical protein
VKAGGKQSSIYEHFPEDGTLQMRACWYFMFREAFVGMENFIFKFSKLE